MFLQTRSSFAHRLDIDAGAQTRADGDVEGVVDMTLDATQRHAEPPTENRLYGWHAAHFPVGRSGRVAAWRNDATGPMQVVSSPIGREWVHFQAPAAGRSPAGTAVFLDWFNAPVDVDPILKAAVAPLWFVTIHPFDDGDGRIARALARADGSPRRFDSMSAQIRAEREAYYTILERSQKGTMDGSIGSWAASDEPSTGPRRSWRGC